MCGIQIGKPALEDILAHSSDLVKINPEIAATTCGIQVGIEAIEGIQDEVVGPR